MDQIDESQISQSELNSKQSVATIEPGFCKQNGPYNVPPAAIQDKGQVDPNQKSGFS